MKILRLVLHSMLFLAMVACDAAGKPDVGSDNAGRPSFLIIMTDDMGFTDLGAFGGQDIGTPNLDRLAMNGIRFTNFHGHLSCAPSRATLMSGTGNHEAGLGTQTDIESFRGQRNHERYLVDRVATLPEILSDSGYRTYLSGKWGLGGPPGIDPTERGFDQAFALVPSGSGHYEAIFHETRYSHNGAAVAETTDHTYSTTLFTDHLISFFAQDRESDQPFFALYTPTAPHWPLHFPPGMEKSFAGKYDAGYEWLRELRIAGASSAGVIPPDASAQDFESEAASWEALSDDERALQSRVMEIYAAMTAHLDQEIGRLLNHMRDIGELDNTLILFINDNGAQGGRNFGGPRTYSEGRVFDNEFENLGNGNSWVNMGQGWAEAVTAPFRDGKGSVYEGGIRVAAFASWSGRDNPPSIYREYLNNMDVMPTLLELANISHPAPQFNGRNVIPMRGQSFAEILRGVTGPVHPAGETITLSSAGRHFVQRGDWKLLKDLDTDWELYDLATDPYERVNLAEARPKKLQEMLLDFHADAEKNNIIDR